MTQSQKGCGVRNPHTGTSSASVLTAGERRRLLARARFAEQVGPSLGRVTAVGPRSLINPTAKTGCSGGNRQHSASPGGFLGRLGCTKVLTSGVSSWPATALAFSNSLHQTSVFMPKRVPGCPKTCSGRRTRNHGTGERSALHRDAQLRRAPLPGQRASRVLLAQAQTTACRQRRRAGQQAGQQAGLCFHGLLGEGNARPAEPAGTRILSARVKHHNPIPSL